MDLSPLNCYFANPSSGIVACGSCIAALVLYWLTKATPHLHLSANKYFLEPFAYFLLPCLLLFSGELTPEGSLIGNGSALLVEVGVSWVVLGYTGLPFVTLLFENFILR
jgi:hypothetical protein